jgi:anaerobic selenocysteine-containing dehydrogenase
VAQCGIVVTVESPDEGPERVVRVRGDDDHPLSHGYTCVKGRALDRYHHHPQRLDAPLLRTGPDRPLAGADWETVLDDLTAVLRSAIGRSGADSVACYLGSGAAFDTAGNATAEAFLRAIGSRQKYTSMTVDTPCKPLIAEMVGGWSGLLPTLDPDLAEMVIMVGTNPVVSHGHSNGFSDPVRRLRELAGRGARLWVIDPRRSETANLVVGHGGHHSARYRRPTGSSSPTWPGSCSSTGATTPT